MDSHITYARERMQNYGKSDGRIRSWWDERIESLEQQLSASLCERDRLQKQANRDKRRARALAESSFWVAMGFCFVILALVAYIIALKGWS